MNKTDITKDIKLPYRLERPFRKIHSSGYHANLPEVFYKYANKSNPDSSSPFCLLEDKRPLNWPHMNFISIFYSGGGNYNHLGEGIFFSTSDGTDPNINGRVYDLDLAAPQKTVPDGMMPLPKYVHIVLSNSCNLWCRTCRPKITHYPFMELSLFEKLLDEICPASELRLDSGGGNC